MQVGGWESPFGISLVVDRLSAYDAVLGPAADGGWWVLGLRDGVPVETTITSPIRTAHSDVR